LAIATGSGTAPGRRSAARALVGLLRAYERILAERPLSRGNRAFTVGLVRGTIQLAHALALEAAGDADLGELCGAVTQQSRFNHQGRARQIVRTADAWLSRSGGAEELLLPGSLPRLLQGYPDITVVFGPGLGLGDETSFLRLVQRLFALASRDAITVLTQYPEVWTQLVPNIREVVYRGDPLLLLRHFDGYGRGRSGGGLIVFGDYEHPSLRAYVLGARPQADALEVSLGQATAWFTPRGGGWTQIDHLRPLLPNHYWTLHALGNRLLGVDAPVWAPVRSRPMRTGSARTILINPLSSKPVLRSAHQWADLLRKSAQRVAEPLHFRVIVNAGLDRESDALARDVGAAIAASVPRSAVELLGGAGTSASEVGRRVARVMEDTDLCLTLDTYTAHLAPLFGVTTIVLAHADNRQFWCPSPWAFYCLPEEQATEATRLIAHVLGRDHTAQVTSGLRRALRKAWAQPADANAVAAIFGQLSATLDRLSPQFPFRERGQRWAITWSRLAWALDHGAQSEHVLAYRRQWEQDEFAKALFLEVGGAGNVNA